MKKRIFENLGKKLDSVIESIDIEKIKKDFDNVIIKTEEAKETFESYAEELKKEGEKLFEKANKTFESEEFKRKFKDFSSQKEKDKYLEMTFRIDGEGDYIIFFDYLKGAFIIKRELSKKANILHVNPEKVTKKRIEKVIKSAKMVDNELVLKINKKLIYKA